MRTYQVNEIFLSVQGEGVRTGTANVFVRFTGCNLACDVEPGPRSPGGFACDTEFASGRKMPAEEIVRECEAIAGPCRWAVLTGGEPGLQLDVELIQAFKERQWKLAVETNGTLALPEGLDWITVSPKVAEHALKQTKADEVKYVRGYGQAIPMTMVEAAHKLLSPAFEGDQLDGRVIAWCIKLIKENPEWRLSTQLHKFWKIR